MTPLGNKFLRALLGRKEKKKKIVCSSGTNGLSLSDSPPGSHNLDFFTAGQNHHADDEKDDFSEGDVLDLDQLQEICTLLDSLVAAGEQRGMAEGPWFVKEVHEFREEPNSDARIRMAHSIQDRFLVEGCENFVRPMLSIPTCNQLEMHLLFLNPVEKSTKFNGQGSVMRGIASRTMFDRAVLDVLTKLLDPLESCRENIYKLYRVMHLTVDSVGGGSIIKEENSKSSYNSVARENAGKKMIVCSDDTDTGWFLDGCGNAATSSSMYLFNPGSPCISSTSSS